jgi:predicted nucleic acid-binding protein
VSLVLDSSVTLAWVYTDERTPAVASIEDRVAMSGAWVPQLWRLEVANSLQIGIRRGRLSPEERAEWLVDFASLNIVSDSETDARAWSDTLALSTRFGLTVYDAAYLELAHRRGLPLASLDRELRASAEELGVPLLGA